MIYGIKIHHVFCICLPQGLKKWYAALPQPYILQNTAEMESPKTQWQRQLLEVWQTVLRLQAIGINDDFFMCGGDSIKAISLVNRINQSLHINIMSTIFICIPLLKS